MSGEQIAREAGAYLALVDELHDAGRDPFVAARKHKPPPLDVETVYSEGAWMRLRRLGLPAPVDPEIVRRLLR
jgi:hypothetical protein